MTFKVGDIVVVTNLTDDRWNGSIIEVTKVRQPTSIYGFECKMLKPVSDDFFYGAGSDVGGWPSKYLRHATVSELVELPLPNWEYTPTTCQCPSDKLFNFGCQCGGN